MFSWKCWDTKIHCRHCRKKREASENVFSFFSLFFSLCLHSLPLFLTTPASGHTMSFLCVCIPGPYALTNKGTALHVFVAACWKAKHWLWYPAPLISWCSFDLEVDNDLRTEFCKYAALVHAAQHWVTKAKDVTTAVMRQLPQILPEPSVLCLFCHRLLTHTYDLCFFAASLDVGVSAFCCRTRTGNRLWLTGRPACWTSWTLQVKRSTVPWGISTWEQGRASFVSLPSTTPSHLRIFTSTGVCKTETKNYG